MNWEKVRLGDVIHEPISGEWGEEGTGTKVIRNTNFTNDGRLNLNSVAERSIDANKVEKKKLQPGDVIIEKSGGSPSQPVGRVVYFDVQDEDDYVCSNFTSIIRPTEKVFPRFLFWLLFNNHAERKTLQFQNKTTGILNLQLKRYVESTEFPLPPLSVQRQIAAVLDAADVVRQKDKALLSRYDALLQSIFHQLFGDLVQNEKGWEVKKLGEVVIVNPRLSSIEKELSPDVPVSFIPMAAVSDTDGCVIELAERPLGEVQKGFTFFGNEDVIFAKITPCMENGKAAIVRELRNGFGFGSTEFHVLRCGTELLPEYLFSIIRRKEFRDAAARNMTGSAGQKRVPTDYVKRLEIPIPPLSLQSQFSGMAQNIQRQKALVKQQAAQSEALFQSLLHRSFQSS